MVKKYYDLNPAPDASKDAWKRRGKAGSGPARQRLSMTEKIKRRRVMARRLGKADPMHIGLTLLVSLTALGGVVAGFSGGKAPDGMTWLGVEPMMLIGIGTAIGFAAGLVAFFAVVMGSKVTEVEPEPGQGPPADATATAIEASMPDPDEAATADARD